MMNDYYKQKLDQGLHYQDFISDKLGIAFYSSTKYQYEVGESKIGLEVKLDNETKNTGNLYIELYEKSDPNNKDWIESGILRKDNTCLYLIGNFAEAYMFSKRTLVAIKDKYKNVETKTSKGFLISKEDAIKLCIRHFDFGRTL